VKIAPRPRAPFIKPAILTIRAVSSPPVINVLFTKRLSMAPDPDRCVPSWRRFKGRQDKVFVLSQVESKWKKAGHSSRPAFRLVSRSVYRAR
jgi:hypothetical protein